MEWAKVNYTNFKIVSQFLIKNEKITLNITSRLKKNKKLTIPDRTEASLYYLQNQKIKKSSPQKIIGVLLITQKGNLYCTNIKQLNTNQINDITHILLKENILISTVLFIPQLSENMIKKMILDLNYKLRASEFYQYDLMEYKPKIPLPPLMNRNITKIEFNKKDNIDIITKLHSSYLLEEVSTPLRSINLSQANIISKKLLKNQIIATAFQKDKIIAKGNTNLIGFQYVQLGGIYTIQEERQRGAGTLLVRALTQRLYAANKNVLLFVKKENQLAKSIYRKSGFEIYNNLSLIYFK